MVNLFAALIIALFVSDAFTNKSVDEKKTNDSTQSTINKTEKKEIAVKEVKAEIQKEEVIEEIKELNKSIEPKSNYLSLALYISGFILLVSIAAYIYFRRQNNSLMRSEIDDTRRELNEEINSKPQEQQPVEEEAEPETEVQPVEEEVKSEPQEQQPVEEEAEPETEVQPVEEEAEPQEEKNANEEENNNK